jgi:transcriptional regulator with XRE-family HTH domain
MSLTLAERFGFAIQKQRQAHGLSQSQLARMAKLSMKYVGEMERGEANATMEAIQRISNALEWDPWELPLREQDTLPEGVRTLLLAELVHMKHLVETAISWVQTLDAAMVRRAPEPSEESPTPAPPTWPEEQPQRPRGRPRTPKARGRRG